MNCWSRGGPRITPSTIARARGSATIGRWLVASPKSPMRWTSRTVAESCIGMSSQPT